MGIPFGRCSVRAATNRKRIAINKWTGSNGNCANSSNPYHQCTQACFQKTKNGKKTTITTSSSSRTSSQRRSSVTTNGERRPTVVAGCPKASNPYHKCDANCNKTTSSSNSAATPHSKIDQRKKRVASKPVPPVLNTVPATTVRAANNNISNASSTKQNYSENKKVDEIIPSSGPIFSQLHTLDVMPKDQFKDGATEVLPIQKETNKEDKVASSNEIVPITNSNEYGAKDFSFSGTSLPLRKKDGDTSSEGEEDSVSVISESRILIGKYNVKECFGSILQTILDKYGDIGASCDLESVVMRSYYMECVCFVVQELLSSSDSISKSKVNELSDIVKDVESAHLRVAWLRNTLDEIAENIELISQQQDMETEKANYDREMESLREQLELDLENLAQKEQEVADINKRIPEIRDRLSKLEQLVSSALVNDQTTLPIKSKIDQLL